MLASLALGALFGAWKTSHFDVAEWADDIFRQSGQADCRALEAHIQVVAGLSYRVSLQCGGSPFCAHLYEDARSHTRTVVMNDGYCVRRSCVIK